MGDMAGKTHVFQKKLAVRFQEEQAGDRQQIDLPDEDGIEERDENHPEEEQRSLSDIDVEEITS
jgi:hypothetical protein